jgi:glycosyltransferase involved in cell wall biosynthesis
MKIKYVVDIRIPTERAHGYQICKMCEEFATAGANVELIIPHQRNNYLGNIFDFYKLKKNFLVTEIYNFNSCGFWVKRLSFPWFAKRYLKGHDYDVVYARDEFSGIFFNNYILELHNLSVKFFWWWQKLFKKAEKIFVLTDSLRQELVDKYRISDKNIIVVPDAVDLEKFNLNISRAAARKKLQLPSEQTIILYSGHLYPWKGAQSLAEAAKCSAGVFYFVGGIGKDYDNFVVKNQELITNGQIIVVGFRNHTEIPYWLAAADILVLPNSGKERISSHYTSPLKLFEYMAARRPIIASDLPSLREMLNEENAVFFESDNPDSLAEAIKKVLADNILVDKISNKAFADVANYTWKKRAEKILKEIGDNDYL